MKKITAVLLCLALNLALVLPVRAAGVSPVLKIENGALTLEGLGEQAIYSVQLELTMRGTGKASFSFPAGNGSQGSYGVGKTDGNKLTIYIDSPQPLNRGGTASLGRLELNGNEVTRANLTLLDRDLAPGAILDEASPIQVRQTSAAASGNTSGGTSGGTSGSSGGSDGGSGSTGTGSAAPSPSLSLSFSDVPADAYYAGAVAWAVERGVTTGTTSTTFSPDASCTRAQIVTFLWRAAGSPAVGGTSPFEDVEPGEYYYDAVLWAVENGVTTGTTSTTFSPGAPCTRAQIVTFLWRTAGSPAVNGSSPFEDVDPGEYYYDAVLWAVERGVTTGTTSTTFSPGQDCTRAQIVTFLYRDRAG